jgi:hypothetical protein
MIAHTRALVIAVASFLLVAAIYGSSMFILAFALKTIQSRVAT